MIVYSRAKFHISATFGLWVRWDWRVNLLRWGTKMFIIPCPRKS